ncbi:hypothetical protein CA13_11940 [Planctomycetes bacterium CA13]|uniref:Uncharacterized protein n=1 Tax=Novipirellula herctigrandis TaxID=2527986 RepID=A0A5C5YYW4_9BACT|nr:hypothetical protein CA13_11940 [Planctomycetes bacterium CA13]
MGVPFVQLQILKSCLFDSIQNGIEAVDAIDWICTLSKRIGKTIESAIVGHSEIAGPRLALLAEFPRRHAFGATECHVHVFLGLEPSP